MAAAGDHGFPALQPDAEAPAGRAQRLSNTVADRITADILQRQLEPGTMLGMEPELMQRYGVSRATLREAIRQIEARGVARMRRGAGGGLIAAGTPVSIAAATLATYFEFSAVTLAGLVRARSLLEAHAAALAASRARDEDLAGLREAIASWRGVDDPLAAREMHFALRAQILAAAASPMVEMATRAFLEITADISSLLTGTEAVAREYLIGHYRRRCILVEAIAAGDAAAARAIVREEGETLLTAPNFAPHLESALPDLVLESGVRPSIGRAVDTKLGVATALRLRRDIVEKGWSEGEVVGTEVALCRRYEVSRSLMREALMLLEINGIVRIVRGRVGGIEVGRPHPRHTIAAVAEHLDYVALDAEDVRALVAEVDVAAAGRAAGTIDAETLARICPASPRTSYAALAEAVYPPPEQRAAELICDIARTCDAPVAQPPGRLPTRHLKGLCEALDARDGALAMRHMRGLWGGIES